MSDEHQTWAPRDPSAASASPGNDEGAQGSSSGNGKKGRTKRPKRTGWRRLFPTWRMVLGSVLVAGLLLVGGFFAGYQLVDIPAANAGADAQSNVYFYKDGTVLARDGEVNREKVKLSQVPSNVQHAVLAAEDRDFYHQPAVDVRAMFRAGWNTVTGKGKQGGSTITQQYVKNYYLGQERTVVRKAKEFFIAIKLNREQSKDQIFEGYLNTSYFGRNAYGIQAAAQAYYGKNVEDLTTAEGAYLASLLNAPSQYDVVAHPGNKPAALDRWTYVLDGMVKEGWLDPGERSTTEFPVPGEAKPSTGLSGQRGYLVQAVEAYLTGNGIIDEETLATGGHRITTTLDKKKQDAFVAAVKDNVMKKRSGDREADKNVRVGGASIVPETGEVVAMYGGIDYTQQYVNNATRRDYQVGSTFKPFVFTAAVANDSTTQDGRRITPETYYDGTNKRTVQGPQGSTGYDPANEDDVDYGQITVRTATDKSVNSVYAQMAQDVGPEKVRETAVALGIPKTTPDLTASPSIALGPATASVLDLTEAYATLANHGRHGPYTLVDKVTKDGTEIELPDRKTEQAVSREAADTTTALLRSVVEGGTGSAAQAVGRPAVGKTGTAEEDKAAWFAGYTPDLATVVAVMGQNPESGIQTPLYGALGLDRVNGGGAPAETWAAYTEAALRSSPAKEFDLETAPGSDEPQEPGEDGTDTATGPTTPDGTPSSTAPSTPADTTTPSAPTAPASSAPPANDNSSTGTTGGATGGADGGGATGGDGDGGTGTGTEGGTDGGTDDSGTGTLGGTFIEGVRGARYPG
ncbi:MULTISPECIES: transglycosylase domain-containing protein [unclassified Streptomyces]|uniref:transglycosylase domain-containing protein n=1 Tax=unclassified Streptomyces TaxID=2593676 RepID=UPI00081E61D2|nr:MULTISPECIES: transglycosylase domain-containing protein [unclassified Streptomyces]MYR94190.1 penicillin-binding protein [Streptomyces sp. SID4937]SCD66666.1 Membrane carboxypeptidase (penicillin-binding protein) [Streptomyces sp. ScaeMP-e83]